MVHPAVSSVACPLRWYLRGLLVAWAVPWMRQLLVAVCLACDVYLLLICWSANGCWNAGHSAVLFSSYHGYMHATEGCTHGSSSQQPIQQQVAWHSEHVLGGGEADGAEVAGTAAAGANRCCLQAMVQLASPTACAACRRQRSCRCRSERTMQDCRLTCKFA